MNALFKKEMPILVEGLKLVHKKYKDRFDMGMWSSHDEKTPTRSAKCNTSGCALGWKNSFIKNSPIRCRVEKGKYYNELVPRYKDLSNFDAIQAAYDLTIKQVDYLFTDDDYEDTPTALDVAQRIEKVLYDGFPDHINEVQAVNLGW
jgi:hypothetical protein